MLKMNSTVLLIIVLALSSILHVASTLAMPKSAMIAVTTFAENEPILSNNIEDEERLLILLKTRDFVALESAIMQIQAKFEAGSLSEIELRNTYRLFLNIDEQDLAKIEEWEKANPSSYAAHVIRGVYFKRKGFDVRGGKVISQTPQENLDKMQQYHEIAITELRRSLKLTQKPFLSMFHLLDIAKFAGNREVYCPA